MVDDYMSGLSNILEYAKQAYQSYMDEDEVSPEAELLLSIIRARNLINQPVVPTSVITNDFNMGRETNERWKTIAVGRLIKRLGFYPKRTSEGKGGWLITEKHLDRLRQRYNVVEKVVQVKL